MIEEIVDIFKNNYSVILEITGLIFGLFYLFFEYRASKWVWLFAILMPMISMNVYYNRGIYADFGINIYYLITAIYGFLMWNFGGKTRKGVNITRATSKVRINCIIAGIALWVFIYIILVVFTDSNVPVLDSFTTALSMIGSWMLARKYVEQWLVWIVVDIVSVGLYLYKGI